jgi:predicted Zn-dependent protease
MMLGYNSPLRRLAAIFMVATLLLASFVPAHAQSGSKPALIRDAEIEGLMRLYTRPILKAAGINPASVKVYLINDSRINAFVAGGQRIFINTGLLVRAKTPNEVIGVLAHETGHIAGGHLARMGVELEHASVTSIIGMLVGVAAIAGGAIAGDPNAGKAGQGVFLGAQGLAQRNFFAYQRSMEASADQAALKYLGSTGQSAKGMLTLFEKLASESIATILTADPYVMSHPMPLDRIRNLEEKAKKSPYFDKPDAPELMLRHRLMQAKLTGFLESSQAVMQRYPSSDGSLPARYARAIALFRRGDIAQSIPIIDSLVKDLPQNPYFWELKGQALLENGRAAEGVTPLKEAVRLLPNNGLIQILLAQALIDTEDTANAKQALKMLRLAQKTEREQPVIYKYMARAYGLTGDNARAELSTAEAALLSGDRKLAMDKAKSAQARFKTGTPEWTRANDILTFASRK